MNEKLKILICLLVFLVMPVLLGVIVAKAFANHNGTLLAILFFALIALELVAAVYKVIKYNNRKKDDE